MQGRIFHWNNGWIFLKNGMIKNEKFGFTTYWEVRILICVVCVICQNFFPVRAKKKIRKCASGKKIWSHRQKNGISVHMMNIIWKSARKRRLKRNSFCAAAFRIRPSAGREAERAGASVPPVGSAAASAAVRRRNGGRQSAYPCALSF